MKEYELFLPLYYNDGTPIAPGVIPALRVRLLEQFNGVTFFPQSNEGYWQMAGVTYRDEIVIFRVVASKPRVARRFFRQLKEEVDRFATAIAALGVGKRTRVAIQLPNLPQTVIAYYATLSVGGQAVMTNPLYVEREIEHQWNDAGCSLAVTTDFLFERRIKAIRGALPVKNYVIASIPKYLRFPLNLLAPVKLKRAQPPLLAKVSKLP